MGTQGKPTVIGGADYSLDELLTWHPAHLADLVIDYQRVRTWWTRADSACGTYVQALEAELRATKRELEGARVELKLRRRATKVRPAGRAA